MRILSARAKASSSGRYSTNCPPRRCSTPRERPAIPRACCTPIARTCCTPSRSAAPMVGAKLVLPGPKLDAASIAELIEGEGVTVTAGVPTLYNNLLKYLEEQGRGAGTLKRIAVAGSAPAPRMIEGFERLGVSVSHVWGMTET